MRARRSNPELKRILLRFARIYISRGASHPLFVPVHEHFRKCFQFSYPVSSAG